MKMGLPVRKDDAHYTYRDYRTWPVDERWELIDGVAYNMSPAPRVVHQVLLTALFQRLVNFLDGKSCQLLVAPVDVFFKRIPLQLEDDAPQCPHVDSESHSDHLTVRK